MDISGSSYTAASIAYSFDGAHQLTKEERTGGNAFTDAFWYDSAGNRTKIDSGGTPATYAYDYIDRMTLSGASQYQWDYWGNVTKIGTDNTYYWDDADRLTKFDGSGTTNDTEYVYAPGSWERVRRDQGGTVRYFTWDGDNQEAIYTTAGVANWRFLTPYLDDTISTQTGGAV